MTHMQKKASKTSQKVILASMIYTKCLHAIVFLHLGVLCAMLHVKGYEGGEKKTQKEEDEGSKSET